MHKPLVKIPVGFRPHGQNVKFFLLDDEDGVEGLSSSLLEAVVRDSALFAFDDGDTIAEAGSHSDAELWSDVILPAVEVGLILVTVGGELL